MGFSKLSENIILHLFTTNGTFSRLFMPYLFAMKLDENTFCNITTNNSKLITKKQNRWQNMVPEKNV